LNFFSDSLQYDQMYSLLVGAGFSKWAVNLPLVNDLFDFNIDVFNRSDQKRVEVAKSLKAGWDRVYPGKNSEEFIGYALGLSEDERKAVLWYVARRLSEPFIWEEVHAQRWRRHVLMIDENRKFAVKGLIQARDFLHGFLSPSIAGIVTTNYDLVVEYALGSKLFNYGSDNQILLGRGPYPVSTWRNPVRLRGTLSLAKIHGSVSWDWGGFYTDGRRSITGDALLVAPTREKDVPKALKSTWNLAEDILNQSTRLLVFGFAFNPYDQLVMDLLRLHGSNISSVLLIDVAPKLEAARQVWPHASIACCPPPPHGRALITDWKKSF
jgi:hypothetical protein